MSTFISINTSSALFLVFNCQVFNFINISLRKSTTATIVVVVVVVDLHFLKFHSEVDTKTAIDSM